MSLGPVKVHSGVMVKYVCTLGMRSQYPIGRAFREDILLAEGTQGLQTFLVTHNA